MKRFFLGTRPRAMRRKEALNEYREEKRINKIKISFVEFWRNHANNFKK